MPETPLETGADGVQANPRKTGYRRLDLIVAGAAILISVVSLVVAFENGRTEQRMVAANSWPFLVYSTTRNTIAGQSPLLVLRIDNSGVGPARLKSLIVRYKGRPVHGLVELLQRCCGAREKSILQLMNGGGLVAENQPVGVYSARDGMTMLAVARTAGNSDLWNRLAAARQVLKFEACYCSVLGECWTSDFGVTSDPVPVDACPISNPDNYRE